MTDVAALLPEHLRGRASVEVPAPPRRGRVLYWMRIAARGHENPALDAAIAAADALGTSVLVYHAVSERYPYASDRLHTFILEGARDVARELRERGVAYALHVERPGSRGPYLRQLAEEAALVVTEAAPFPPLAAWTAALARHLAAVKVPMLCVDASCIVPMGSVPGRHERAFTFRAASASLAEVSLAAPWFDLAPTSPPDDARLPFSPVAAEQLDDRTIADLIARCAIDHAVGPVRGTCGGAQAGYARWRAFANSALAEYHTRRDDAARDGTSRLSPWLHFGHVSPHRIAREVAARRPEPGPLKFLDEILIWRELAWHFASHVPNLETVEALPAWARATLAVHAGDPREPMSLERLERGQTGDRLWDLAQRSLMRRGELHNSVRMTWGKAIPGWTRDLEAARAALVTLNNRYALDGRDPASYGGLYWCLGLFDRAFTPEVEVLGAVRSRPTAKHAERLDLAAFEARACQPSVALGRVAVIGAGVAGLACARTLRDHCLDVTVFDKGRAPGGRLSGTRGEALEADLGAPYFTVRDQRFERFVASWREEGVVARWDGRIRVLDEAGAGFDRMAPVPPVERFVGVPGMNAIARHLAKDGPVRLGHRVDVIARDAGRYRLEGVVAPPGVTLQPGQAECREAFGDFDVVLVCLPSEQANALLAPVHEALSQVATSRPCAPCLALAFTPADGALRDVPLDGLFIGRDGDPGRVLSWLARDASKPGRRSDLDCWVAHADPVWSQTHLRDSEGDLQVALLAEVARILQVPAFAAAACHLRRWAYARAPADALDEAPFDDAAGLGVTGDWAAGGRVEGAFLAGVALAGRVLGSLGGRRSGPKT